MFDVYSKRRMLAAVIFLGGLTFIVLIFESHWAFEASSVTHFGNYSNLQKNASGNICKADEVVEVVEACHPCSDFEIASKSNKACLATHFKEAITCQKSGIKSYRSCEKVQWMEERKFWQFEFLIFVLALTSSASVVLRQKVLDQKHLRTLQRRLANSV
ncbi:Jumping translocation breakpoint protein [Nesidiocoris tenuis]|uniref:Jumping translocation breakpoint protein n=1 Tax=Nesidiocoris tenuis TaxID=355587 RepID=A0ABN7AWE2_9HEMI|nr:Jumping translocation breakpoint protein [Nesidiocoris tenuis]